MLYQFNSDGTVSLLAQIERYARDLPESNPRAHGIVDRDDVDAWIAQDYWRVRVQSKTGSIV